MLLGVLGHDCMAQNLKELSWYTVANGMPREWYASDEAIEVADKVVFYQTEIGGWPKNVGFHKEINQEHMERVKSSGIGATFDNEATTSEMRFLAKVHEHRKNKKYREAFLKGVRYIFKAQYNNGGWPQFFPVRKGKSVSYSGHITFNDGAYVNVMNLLRDIFTDAPCFQCMELDADIKQQCRECFKKGIQCILDTQIKKNNVLTVWCAQHDAVTLLPAKARAYELPSFSSAESADIVMLLVSLPHPSEDVIAAVKGAVAWFDSHQIKDMRYERYKDELGEREARLVPSPGNSVWARFYDLDTGCPFFCGRDGIKKDNLNAIDKERRGGYSWYTSSPSKVLKYYTKWLKQTDQ